MLTHADADALISQHADNLPNLLITGPCGTTRLYRIASDAFFFLLLPLSFVVV